MVKLLGMMNQREVTVYNLGPAIRLEELSISMFEFSQNNRFAPNISYLQFHYEHSILCGSLSQRQGMSTGADGEVDLQIWRVAANILNKQSGRAYKKLLSSLENSNEIPGSLKGREFLD
jgi:hypothetical protein